MVATEVKRAGKVARLGERERVEVLVSEIYCTAA
jgi:hypothetical protein